MSDEPQALERSTLQKKDRAELITIATAMGAKPGSRAKKADVIDIILDLAGVSSDDAAPETPVVEASDTAPSGADGEQGGEDAGEAAAAPGEPAGSDTPDEDGPDEDAGAARGQRAPGRGGRGDGARVAQQSRGGRDQGAKDQGGRGQTDTDKGSPDQGGRKGANQDRDGGTGGNQNQGNQGGRDQGNQGQGNQSQGNQSQGNQNQGNQNQDQGGQGDDDGEAGNRRRRRRGRDRDRSQQDDQPFQGEPTPVEGVLDLRDEGYGFLRVSGYLPSADDVYVSVKQTRQFSLRRGDRIAGASRPPTRNEKNPALMRIDSVNGVEAEQAKQRPAFSDLTPLFPDSRLTLESAGDPYNMTARIVDLLAPIGKGQRGLIVSPPKAGKTTIMKHIARAIETNHPEVQLIVLLVDERPEEVTDMRRWITKGEVAASTFDRPSDEHIQVAELVIDRAKRLVEGGADVVVILDGITRLARAYNQAAPAGGRVMSGGVDASALYPPKKIFGAARNVEEGGSLTILATALVETGSKMDEVIFEEFKGTGNMELRLDRHLAEQRVYPAIDVEGSSTRHEELLFDNKSLQQVWKLRRVLSGMAGDGGSHAAGIELLTDRMRTFKNNEAFLSEIAKAPAGP
ncbi:MAG: transcription termination factor Rho [Acidimicrobiales bacterium]